MSFQTSALILSWVAILLLALVVSGLVRQVHALSAGLVRPATEPVGLPGGAAAPGLDQLRTDPDRPTLLLFLSADCRTCTGVLAEAASLAELAVRAVYAGPAPADTRGVPAVGNQAELFDRYDAVATPFAVLVEPAGRVRWSAPVGSPAALRTLLDAPVPAEEAL
jgi:hypothetical protein